MHVHGSSRPDVPLELYLANGGPILDGAPPAAPAISIITDSSQRAASAVNFLADQGVDLIKIYNGVAEDVLVTIASTAHTRGLAVSGHVPHAITATTAAQVGLDGIEHSAIRARDLLDWGLLTETEAQRIGSLKSVTEREALVWQHVDLGDARVRMLIDRLAASRVTLDPTLSIDEYDTLFL